MDANVNTNGENVLWFRAADGTQWNYPADYWHGREDRRADFRVIVEDGENCGSIFETGDVIEISAFTGDLRPGDFVLAVDAGGGCIRRIKSCDNFNGPFYGKVKAVIDLPFEVEIDPDAKRGQILGRVINLIRDLEPASRNRENEKTIAA